MRKFEINWRWVFWVGVIIMLVWLYLKDIGVINTPLIVEAIPYITALGVLLAMARELGKYMHKIDRAILDIRDMKGEMKEVKTCLTSLDKRVAVIEARG